MPPGTRRRSCSTARSTVGADRSATAVRRVAIERLEARAATLPRVARAPGGAGGNEPSAQDLVAEGGIECLYQPLVVTGIDEQGAVAEHFGQGSGPSRHDGHARPPG